jgi:hypothetical protein
MFLDIKPFSPKERPAKERIYSNWLKIAQAIYSTTDKVLVLRILQLELTGLNRQQVIDRLYSRFSSIRAYEERYNLISLFNTVKEFKDVEVLFNWPSVLKYLNAESRSLDDIKGLILLEYNTQKRSYMLKRLYGKFYAMRMKQEREEMKQWSLKK